MMFPNLRAELARKNITYEDIASEFGKSRYWVQNRLQGKVVLGVVDGIKIRDTFFPDLDLDYLFSMDELQPTG